MVALGLDAYTWIVVLSGIFAFMAAFGIGSNDMANIFATTVGSKALTVGQVVIVAAFCEFGGAVLLGASVTATIKAGVVRLSSFTNSPAMIMFGFLCVLIAAAFWDNTATHYGFPVSTTHTTGSMYTAVFVALLCAFKGVNACRYNTVGGSCYILDDFAPNCYECSTSTDLLINGFPTSLEVGKHIGPCGCVITVRDPNAAVTLCESLDTVLIYTMGLAPSPLMLYDCLRDKQFTVKNILDNEACNGCTSSDGPVPAPTPTPSDGPVPAPTPTPSDGPVPAPTPTPTPTPTVDLTPTQDSTPTPTPTPTVGLTPTQDSTPTPTPTPTVGLTPTQDSTPTPTPTPTPAASSNGGTSCIAQDQKVIEENRGKINVSDLKIDDRVMTYQGFQDFIGYIHNGSFQYTLKITIDTGSTVELTEDHLVKVGNNYVHAIYVKIGDQVSSGKVTKITNGMSFVVSPLTRSGTIIVNDVVLSCYANVFSHHIANFVLAPLRVNLIKNVSKYFSALIAVYNVSPKWFRHMIAANDSYTF